MDVSYSCITFSFSQITYLTFYLIDPLKNLNIYFSLSLSHKNLSNHDLKYMCLFLVYIKLKYITKHS